MQGRCSPARGLTNLKTGKLRSGGLSPPENRQNEHCLTQTTGLTAFKGEGMPPGLIFASWRVLAHFNPLNSASSP